ncbi:CHAT domain-containing protein [Methylosinus sp.]|uniref:CHAT domain-containing protein n=1 Tax=Methylosinus sp. TaxID=427 RepID=UPI0039C9F761
MRGRLSLKWLRSRGHNAAAIGSIALVLKEHDAISENAVEPSDGAGQRSRLVGAAQAFFARGIPNYIGAGWPVDDYWGRVFAEQFYSRALGLSTKAGAAAREPDTIGKALLGARRTTFQMSGDACATWAAYQHYGRAQDRLLASAGAPHPNSDRQASPPEESVAAAAAGPPPTRVGKRATKAPSWSISMASTPKPDATPSRR